MLATLRNRLPLVCAIAFLVCATGYLPRANATLIGTNVTISVVELQGATLTTHYSNTVTVVDPGAEVIGLFNSFNVDLGANSIRLDVTATGPIPPADFFGFLFESLAGVPPAEIVGFSQANANIAGFDLSRLLFDSSAVAFDLEGLNLSSGDFVDVTLLVRQVPEPSTLLLLLAGGAGLMGWARRRSRPRPH